MYHPLTPKKGLVIMQSSRHAKKNRTGKNLLVIVLMDNFPWSNQSKDSYLEGAILSTDFCWMVVYRENFFIIPFR